MVWTCWMYFLLDNYSYYIQFYYVRVETFPFILHKKGEMLWENCLYSHSSVPIVTLNHRQSQGLADWIGHRVLGKQEERRGNFPGWGVDFWGHCPWIYQVFISISDSWNNLDVHYTLTVDSEATWAGFHTGAIMLCCVNSDTTANVSMTWWLCYLIVTWFEWIIV